MGLNEKLDGVPETTGVCLAFISKVNTKLLDGTLRLNVKEPRSIDGPNANKRLRGGKSKNAMEEEEEEEEEEEDERSESPSAGRIRKKGRK